MDIFNANSIEKNFPINVCRCCLAEGCYKDISSEYIISGKKEVYEEMLKDVFNLEISYQKYGGPSCHSRLICENCIGKLRDAKEFKYKVLASEKSFIKFLDDMQINVKEEENIEEADILAEECVIKLEPELNTDNDVESCENDALENSEVVNFVVDVMGVKLESESNTDSEIESHETLENHTERNHTETFENIKLQLKKDLNKLLPGGANVCDKRKLTTEGNTKTKKPRRADEGTSGQLSQCDEDSQSRLQQIPEPQNIVQQNARTRSTCTSKTQTANIKGLKEVTIDNPILSVNSFNASVTNRGDSLRKEQMNAESCYRYQQKRKEQRIFNSIDKTNTKLTINPEDNDTSSNHSSSYSVDELPPLPTDIPRKEQLNAERRSPDQKDQECTTQRLNVQRPGFSLRTVPRIANARKARRLRKRREEQMELEEMMFWALL